MSWRWVFASALAMATSGCFEVFDMFNPEMRKYAERGYMVAPNFTREGTTPIHLIHLNLDMLHERGFAEDNRIYSYTPKFEAFISGMLKEKGLCPDGWKRSPARETEFNRNHIVMSMYVECL